MKTRRNLFLDLIKSKVLTNTTTVLPNTELITHEGRKVNFYNDLIKNKIVLINVLYTKCKKTCPLTTQNLLKVQEYFKDKIGTSIFIYSITLAPLEDSPTDLRAYMQRNSIGPGWTFLTGLEENLRTVKKSIGFTDADPAVEGDRTQHTGMIRIGNDRIDRWTASTGAGKFEAIVRAVSWIEAEPGSTKLIREIDDV
jgi:protein SCO1